nr:PD-(D/E)XK nuclease family protein [Legionella jordanis]
MAIPPMNKKELLAFMHQGAIVITPNNRLSNALLNDYIRQFPNPVQAKPICLPYSAFLQNLYKEQGYNSLRPQPVLLTPGQSRYLWRKILSKDRPVNEGLLNAIEEAWTRCHYWLIDINDPAFSYNSQTLQFQRWAQGFSEELHSIDAITAAQLAHALCSNNLSFFKENLFIWACFDDYTPQQRQLQEYLKDRHNLNHLHFDLTQQDGETYQYAANNDEDEQQQLFSWLKTRLQQGDTRIAVVVPDLEKHYSNLQRALKQHFSADQFNISLGKPLASYPLIAHALIWLELDGKQLDVQQARTLLHSPYLSASWSELLERSQFLETAFIMTEMRFNQETFIQELRNQAPKLAGLLSSIKNYPAEASIEGWIQLFHERLHTLGFPGEIELNSEVYQCYQRFLKLFDDFKELALISPVLTTEEALAAIRELAELNIFQTKSAPAPIQILGLLEAAGSNFDSLWFMGLTDQCLPKSLKPSAFIPVAWQRERCMPLANQAKEFGLAEKSIARFQSASPFTVFSYAKLSGDTPNMASPLIRDLAYFTPLAQDSKAPIEDHLEAVTESYLLPFEGHLTGGASILANQAKCPFRAFAAHRLYSKGGMEPAMGPNSMERGQFIHKVMEIIWQQLRNQNNLLRIKESELNQLIESAISRALETIAEQRNLSFPPLMQDVERERLRRLAASCLNWEKMRPPFEVEALEKSFEIQIAGLDLSLRVDRLDKLENGKKWIIDYKTSIPVKLPWREERPCEPQLLLYALLDEAIESLLFAQLKSGQFEVKGIGDEENKALGISSSDETWVNIREHWQNQLNELAQEFIRGYCPPRPSQTSICQQCDYQNLCRMTEEVEDIQG